MARKTIDDEQKWIDRWGEIRVRGKYRYIAIQWAIMRGVSAFIVFMAFYVVIRIVFTPNTYIFTSDFIVLSVYLLAAWCLVGYLLGLLSWNENEKRYLSGDGQ